MKKVYLSSPIQPKKMTNAERRGLSDRLFSIHSAIFSGVSREQFVKYVVNPATRKTKIYFLLDREGRDVGYITFQQFETLVDRRRQFVYRTEVGILPHFRGNNVSMRLMSREITKSYIASCFRKSYFLATPIHPNPYCAAYNSGVKLFPSPDRETPTHVLSIMDKLSEALNIAKVGIHSRFEKKVGWIVSESAERRSRVAQRTDVASRFYLRQNPEYFKGNGMMILVPVDPLQGLRVLGTFLKRMVRKRFQPNDRVSVALVSQS